MLSKLLLFLTSITEWPVIPLFIPSPSDPIREIDLMSLLCSKPSKTFHFTQKADQSPYMQSPKRSAPPANSYSYLSDLISLSCSPPLPCSFYPSPAAPPPCCFSNLPSKLLAQHLFLLLLKSFISWYLHSLLTHLLLVFIQMSPSQRGLSWPLYLNFQHHIQTSFPTSMLFPLILFILFIPSPFTLRTAMFVCFFSWYSSS